MLITLQVEELLRDLKKKSHEEVKAIEDIEARYRAEAGTEKEHEIMRCMVEAASALSRRLWRYLRNYYQDESDNQLAIPEAFVYDLVMSERRAEGKAQQLADYMHTFIVHLTLSRFYSTVSQQELSNKHSLQSLEDAKQLDELIYSKLPPIV